MWHIFARSITAHNQSMVSIPFLLVSGKLMILCMCILCMCNRLLLKEMCSYLRTHHFCTNCFELHSLSQMAHDSHVTCTYIFINTWLAEGWSANGRRRVHQTTSYCLKQFFMPNISGVSMIERTRKSVDFLHI